MNMQPIYKIPIFKEENIFLFLVPFLVWVGIFRHFLTGNATIIGDTYTIYTYVKFYLDSIRHFVFPLWNPVLLWGTAHVMQIGEYNPILFLIILINKIGVSLYASFIISMMFYFFIGLMGVYLLAKCILKDSTAAYVSFLLALFSSLGMSVFGQIYILFLFVPGVWFFYFFTRFFQTSKRCFFAGAAFALSIILSTYIPFYFLTVLLIFVILYAVFYFQNAKDYLYQFFRFCRNNIVLSLVCAVLISSSLFSTFSVWSVLSKDLVALSRQGTVSLETVHDQGSVSMDFAHSKSSGLIHLLYRDQFSGLHNIKFHSLHDRLYYVSVFFYILLLMSVFSPLNRKIALLMLLGILLFVICLTHLTPVYPFLYKYGLFFKSFRNLFYFLSFLIPIIAILGGVLLKTVCEQSTEEKKGKWLLLCMTVFVHITFFFFLQSKDNVATSTYLTLWGSLVFFVMYFKGMMRGQKIFALLFLIALVTAQPLGVLYAYSENARIKEFLPEDEFDKVPLIRRGVDEKPAKFLFSFERPKRSDILGYAQYEDLNYSSNWHSIILRDAPGFISRSSGYPTRWSYLLFNHIPNDVLEKYVHHKFYLYDRLRKIPDSEAGLKILSQALKTNQNVALIAEDGVKDLQLYSGKINPSNNSEIVRWNTDQFKVLDYNANSLTLKTKLKTDKFLVYNDSYHKSWRATINGKASQIYRANFAFKGLWLPRGENIIRFNYKPYGGQYLYLTILLMHFLFFIYFIRTVHEDIQESVVNEKI